MYCQKANQQQCMRRNHHGITFFERGTRRGTFLSILSNPGAEQQLYENFCMEQENTSFEDGGGAACSFVRALLQAYENRDISALSDTVKQDLIEAQVYSIVWDAFNAI
mgnify:CR=1 FL=1